MPAVNAMGQADAPAVVLIPGVFGSHLKAGGERIWIDLENLAAGKLELLALDGAGSTREAAVEPDGILEDRFGGLVEALSKRFQVVSFAYDWRQSLRRGVDGLAAKVEAALQGDRALHLLAHGSGGLLARALMAYHPATWEKLCQRGGRLVMLGAPNHGAYGALELLSGQAELVRMLALVDSKRGLDDICRQLRSYPGLLELLPRNTGDWVDAFLATLAPDERPGFEQLSAESADTWKELDRAVDPAHMCSVMGAAPSTPAGVEAGEGGVLRFLDSGAGDGFVSDELAELPGVPTWVMDATHGDLASRPEHFDALAELLADGTTAQLPQERSQGAARGSLGTRALRPVLYPDKDAFTAAAMGGTARGPASTSAPSVTLAVSVVHASLEHASYPLAIGHYDGDLLAGAEAVLDSKLGGRLSQRRNLNLYPGKVGTVEVLLNPEGRARGEAKGALVIGLGEVGQITPEIVIQGVAEAALRLALARLDETSAAQAAAPEEPGAETTKRPASAAFSALLIGTRGGRGLAIQTAVAAIVTGALLANRALADRELLDKVCIDAVELIEMYGDLATRAARAVTNLNQYLHIRLMSNEAIKPERFLRQGEGGYAGQPSSEYDAGWWQRIQIKQTRADGSDPGAAELQFLRLTDRARAELTLQATQRALVELLVDKCIHESSTSPDVPATLYELLLPHELKVQPLETTNMLLMLDSKAAYYPWEMLAERPADARNVGRQPLQPLSVRMGMIRQLETGDFRVEVQPPRGHNALVIGDPRLDDSPGRQLPGARAEAEMVAKVLEQYRYDVTKLIQADALSIFNALYGREYRIIHIAAHGIYREKGTGQSGVVLGNGIYLTAAEIGQLRVVPEMVFLNCCHLGVVDEAKPLNKLAASISEELIKLGVRAVVAAGWAVNDRAAVGFAETLYDRMLSGKVAQFGDAVRTAREVVYNDYWGNNTWGAYQCYGDPGFVLHPEATPATPQPKNYVAQQEILLELKNLQARASRTIDKEWITHYRDELQELESRFEKEFPPRWRNGEMLTELGDTYAELGDFKGAILRYRDALAASSPRERVPIRTVEQLANVEARFAIQLSRARERQDAAPDAGNWQVNDLMAKAQRRLELLLELAPTAERYAMLGSYYKRRAIAYRDDRAERNKALENAERNYCLALGQEKLFDKPYHFLNQITCRYLRDDVEPVGEDRERVLSDLAALAKEIQQNRDADLNFWDRIVRADLALVTALVKLMQGQIQSDERKLLDLYRGELETGATSRQRLSVLEQLEFIALILKARGEPAAVAALDRMRERLA